MNDITQRLIGKKVGPGAFRDAIHIAVLPVVAAEDYIEPGNRIKLVAGSSDRVVLVIGHHDKGLGIADPFLDLSDVIYKGDRFFCFLHPNTVTGMRHHWEHVSVDNPQVLSDAEKWLHSFADKWGMNYNEMVNAAIGGEGEYIIAIGRDLHSRSELDPDDYREFWKNIETVTGMTFSEDHKEAVGWSCSC